MQPRDIVGSWISIGSEIPNHIVGNEVYHFCRNGTFAQEFLFPSNLKSIISKAHYTITSTGYAWGDEDTYQHKVIAWIEDGELIMRPNHGMETWFKKIEDSNKPDWLRKFIDHTKELEDSE